MLRSVLTRREFVVGAGALATVSSKDRSGQSVERGVGHWLDDEFGLPCYQYTGPLTFPGSPVRDGLPLLPDDPFFLLGNYRLTLFTYASGRYDLLSGERAWARINVSDEGQSPTNEASVELAGVLHSLVGINSPLALTAEKSFGVGFAKYTYALANSLKVTRKISVSPSASVEDGMSGFLVEVNLVNSGNTSQSVTYRESTRANYQQISGNHKHGDEVTYSAGLPQVRGDVAFLPFKVQPHKQLLFPPDGEMSRLEQYPPALFVGILGSSSTLQTMPDALGMEFEAVIQAGKNREFAFFVGYTRNVGQKDLESLASGSMQLRLGRTALHQPTR